MTQYSILFQNNTDQAAYAMVFQKYPTSGHPEVLSLAWLCKYAYPGTNVQFSWKDEYDFIWAQTGKLGPGVICMASQSLPIGPGRNKVTLTFDSAHGAYHFVDQREGDQPGTFSILADQTVPFQMVGVGIGMSGASLLATQASPNMTYIFSAPGRDSEYWIAFGNYVKGEVLDISSTENAAQVSFPTNIYSMTAILNQDSTWSIQPTMNMRADMLRGGKPAKAGY